MTLIIGNKNYSSWSLRPWVAMRHFGIPFTEVLVALDQPDTARKIAEISPSGKVPVLKGSDVHVWESLAILETLAERNPALGLWPTNARARAMARSVSCEMHAGFATLRKLCPMKVKERFEGFDFSEAEVDIRRIEKLWTDCRREFGAGGPYLFGAFSIADAMFAPVVFRFRTYGISVNETCQAYVKTMLENPAMKEWEQAAQAETLTMARYERK